MILLICSLYCSADGSYQVKLLTKAIVYHSGDILWRPPAIYKGRRAGEYSQNIETIRVTISLVTTSLNINNTIFHSVEEWDLIFKFFIFLLVVKATQELGSSGHRVPKSVTLSNCLVPSTNYISHSVEAFKDVKPIKHSKDHCSQLLDFRPCLMTKSTSSPLSPRALLT